MAIYVDEMVNNLWKIRGRIVKNCHMWSDKDTEELLEFAERIGLKRKWLQTSRKGLIHFDLVESRRKRALELGAIPLTNREVYEMRKKNKKHQSVRSRTSGKNPKDSKE